MKLLFVTPPPYLPKRLHRMRSFDLIKILAKKHEVHLLSVTSEKQEPEEFKEIKKACKSVKIIHQNPIKAILNCLRFPFLPFEVAYCYSSKATEQIHKIIQRENIDMVYLKRLRSAVFLLSDKILKQVQDDKESKTRIPVVIDTTDAMSMFYFRMYKSHPFPKNLFYLWQAVLYKRFERKIMGKIRNWIVCSDVDKKYLQELEGDVDIYIVPNTVDTEYFSAGRIQNQILKQVQDDKRDSGVGRSVGLPRMTDSLLFRGLMDKPVNIDACLFFVKEILPKVHQNIKDIKLFIVGPSPHRLVQKLHNGKDIFVTGFVKDVREYITATTISICPVRIASGTRFKIIQSWAMGRPVVSTAIGAEGLFYKNDYNIAIANTPQEFAEKIIRLLQDKKYYSTLAKNGYKTVNKKYSLKVVGQQLERVLRYVNFSSFNR